MIYETYSAVNTIFGFTYQNNLAIYEALCLIKEIISCKDPSLYQAELNKYALELEYMEDFSIIYGNDYKSIYQVKTGSSTLEESDIFDLLLKVHKLETKGIIYTNSTLSISNLFEKAKNQAKVLLSELDSNPSIQSNGSKKKGTLKRILHINKRAKKDTPDEGISDEDNRIQVKDELEQFIVFLESKIESKCIAINEGEFKTISDIQSKSFGLIKEILETVTPSKIIYKDQNYYEKIYSNLILEIDKYYITEKENRENTYSDKGLSRISLSTIFNCITTDIEEEILNENYCTYKFKETLVNVYENKFIQDLKHQYHCSYSSCSDCKDSACNLFTQFKEIEGLSNNEFNQLFNYLVLKKIDRPDNISYLPDPEKVRDHLFRPLKDIEKLSLDRNLILAYQEKGYCLTMDESSLQTDIEKKIAGNNKLYELIKEADCLITANSNLNNCQIGFDMDNFPNLRVVDLQELENENLKLNEEENYKANVYKPKIVDLIDINHAKEVLNN